MPENNRGVITGADNVDLANAEEDVRIFAENELIDNSADVRSADDVHVRQLLPEEDLESGDDNGYNGTDPEFTQPGLSDGRNEVYEIDSNSKSDKKVIVLFAVTNVSGNPLTTEIEFETGTGGVFNKVQVEGQLTDPEDTLLLADPIVYGLTQDGVIAQYATEAGDDEVVYHGVVAEPTGETLEESTRFLSDQ